MVLPQSPLLHVLRTEISSDIVNLGSSTFLREQPMLDHGADDPGRAFWTKGHRSAAPVIKRVSFFLNDIGGLANAAVKQLGVLEHRRANFLKVIQLAHLARNRLNRVPFPRIGRENVFKALGGGNLGHG